MSLWALTNTHHITSLICCSAAMTPSMHSLEKASTAASTAGMWTACASAAAWWARASLLYMALK